MNDLQFGKSFYSVTDPLPTWSIDDPEELAKCSACGDTLTFVFTRNWETMYPKASWYMLPTGIRCNCFIEERYDGFARHHTLNRDPVPVTPVSITPTPVPIDPAPDKKNARSKRQPGRAEPKQNKRNAKIARKVRKGKRN